MSEEHFSEGNELSGHMLNVVFNFYKFLTPSQPTQKISATTRLSDFAIWHGLDPRTMKKYLEGQTEIKPKLNFTQNDKFFSNSIKHKRLWETLKFVCRHCAYYGECSPAKGCVHCKKCINRDACERQNGTGEVPEDCKLLEELFRYVEGFEKLTYVYFPLKYVLELENDELAVEVLDDYRCLLRKILGKKIDIKYISCVIRYVHMYILSDKVTFLFTSRFYPEEILERVLMKITPDPIDDIRVQWWNKCDKFEKELLLTQKCPKCESTVDDLFKNIENDVSLADIILFTHYFSILPNERLRQIDVRLLQKCLCWKECSPENFLQLCFAES